MARRLTALMMSMLLSIFLVTAVFAVPAPANRKGDLNGDGQINVKDLQLVLHIISGKLKPTPEQVMRGDVAPRGRPDGRITIADAYAIQRVVVGFDKP